MDGDQTTSDVVIRCAIEVHRCLGPGLLESVYESAICIEFENCGLNFRRQVGVPLLYKGHLIAEHRPDLVVEDRLVVEIKSVSRLDPVHVVQVLTYLRVTRIPIGLLLNFNSAVMKQGIRRVVLNAVP